jgi:hypothetical protein
MATEDEKNKRMSDFIRLGFAQKRQRVMRSIAEPKAGHPRNQWLVDELRRQQGRDQRDSE